MAITPSGVMTPTNSTSPGRITLATRLIAEWRRMARQPHNIRRANGLGLPGEPVNHLQEILLRSGLDDSSNADHFDDYLAQLVECAKNDDLATRMVFQRIMPGLIAMAVRRSHVTAGGLPAAFDLIASSAWLVIRRYPIDRRPRRVAANLLMDIEYQELENRGLTECDLQILRAVCHDINSVEMAPHLNIQPRSVRNRRERALHKARKILLQIDDVDQ